MICAENDLAVELQHSTSHYTGSFVRMLKARADAACQ